VAGARPAAPATGSAANALAVGLAGAVELRGQVLAGPGQHRVPPVAARQLAGGQGGQHAGLEQ
jgi:hypothetical protein